MSKNASRNTRKHKLKEADNKPPVKDKFVEEAIRKLPHFEAASMSQKNALAMNNEGRQILMLLGSAGTGKSMLATYMASVALIQKKIDKIYLVRPAVASGKSVGLLPGTMEEKLAPYFAQTLVHLSRFLGKSRLEAEMRTGVIEMKAVEYLRGTSFEDCFVIFEESQNFTEEEMEMLLTRIGRNCKFIFTGDTKQHDLRGESGLAKTVKFITNTQYDSPEFLDDEDMEEINSNIGLVEFGPTDVIRSGLCKAFVKMYYNRK